MSICRCPVEFGFSLHIKTDFFFFPSSHLVSLVTFMQLALAPGVGDMGGGRSTEQGKPL